MLVFSYNQQMKIHLAIYHPQQAGILSAALSLAAEKIILLHRPEDDTAGIQSVIQSRGILCELHETTFDTQMVREQLVTFIDNNQSNELILNASSGYQKLILLAFEQFTLYGLASFMVDKFTDQLIWLNSNSQYEDQHLSHQLKISEYLKSFNTQILDKGQTSPEPESSRNLTQWIIQHIGEYDDAIGSLNYMAMMSNTNHSYELDHRELKNQKLMVLIEQFEMANMLNLRGRKLKFADEKTRFYCNGGWLENHVYALIYGMRTKRSYIADIAKGLLVVRNQGQVKNELDVVAMCHNRLHIIECKTRKFSKSKDENSAANTAIYRLDTIKSLTGGLSGRAMLVSYQALNKSTLSRAKDLGIYCCSHT
jgi:CHAT domain-containing protein